MQLITMDVRAMFFLLVLVFGHKAQGMKNTIFTSGIIKTIRRNRLWEKPSGVSVEAAPGTAFFSAAALFVNSLLEMDCAAVLLSRLLFKKSLLIYIKPEICICV